MKAESFNTVYTHTRSLFLLCIFLNPSSMVNRAHITLLIACSAMSNAPHFATVLCATLRVFSIQMHSSTEPFDFGSARAECNEYQVFCKEILISFFAQPVAHMILALGASFYSFFPRKMSQRQTRALQLCVAFTKKCAWKKVFSYSWRAVRTTLCVCKQETSLQMQYCLCTGTS